MPESIFVTEQIFGKRLSPFLPSSIHPILESSPEARFCQSAVIPFGSWARSTFRRSSPSSGRTNHYPNLINFYLSCPARMFTLCKIHNPGAICHFVLRKKSTRMLCASPFFGLVLNFNRLLLSYYQCQW